MNDYIAHILVVDDDARLRKLLRTYLTEAGFFVAAAQDAKEARALLEVIQFDLVVLDVMMPGETGLQLAPHIRDQYHTPILMLTAMGAPEDRIKGLETGVDDYLAKPFEPRELILRMESILRRTVTKRSESDILTFGPFRFHKTESRLERDGEAVYLTGAEQVLLTMLATHPDEVISRETLAAQDAMTSERSVDVQVTRLRKKLEDDPKKPRYLQTVRGKGYILRQ